MLQKIVNRWTGETIWVCEADCLRDAVMRAVASGISLARADLAGVDLAGVNLARANLAYANLAYANLADASLADANFAVRTFARANLTRAHLVGANFAGADLTDTNFACADLTDTNFAGAHLARASLTCATNAPRIVCVGPIGSRGDYVTFGLRDGAIYVRTGCFRGTLDEFAARVAKTHGDNEHARAYRAACVMAETVLKNS